MVLFLIYRFFLIIKFFYFRITDYLYQLKIQRLAFSSDAEKVGDGHNLKCVVTDEKGNKWVVKFCRNTQGRVPDICEREELTFKLGRLVEIPILRTFTVRATQFMNLLPEGNGFVQNKCVLMPYVEGGSLGELYKDNSRWCGYEEFRNRNINKIRDALVFYHWVGEEDRGLKDLLVKDDCSVLFIDHGLSGPGGSPRLRGTHPYPECYRHEDIILKRHRSKKGLVEFVLKDLNKRVSSLKNGSMIRKIQSTPKFILRYYINKAELQDPNGNDFREKYAEELFSRMDNLQQDYDDWLNELGNLKLGTNGSDGKVQT